MLTQVISDSRTHQNGHPPHVDTGHQRLQRPKAVVQHQCPSSATPSAATANLRLSPQEGMARLNVGGCDAKHVAGLVNVGVGAKDLGVEFGHSVLVVSGPHSVLVDQAEVLSRLQLACSLVQQSKYDNLKLFFFKSQQLKCSHTVRGYL